MASTSDGTEQRLWLKRAEEAITACEDKGYPQFVGFLDEATAALAAGTVRHHRAAEQTLFYGGHAQAERVMLGAFPSYMEPQPDAFPLCAVAFRMRDSVRLDHRQVLGTLMAQGIRREKLGDILCGPGLAVVFADETIGAFLAEQITKIGGEGVRAECPYTGELPVFHQFEPVRATVASARLDAVVKAVTGESREAAARRIRTGTVLCNHQPELSVSAPVKEGDVLSLRGCGRYIVDEISTVTQKGRLVLKARKYV